MKLYYSRTRLSSISFLETFDRIKQYNDWFYGSIK